ncbi:MAG: NAD(P)/FAD-dependent oxidoreductase [Desulfobacteraceae bacterium]
MGKHLVLVGGGHAHLTCLKNLRDFVDRGHRVTLISLSPYHYYSGMGPGMLSGIYRPEQIRFNVRKMAEAAGGVFVAGAVVRINPEKRILLLQSGEEMGYEVVSFNTGSFIPVEKIDIENQDKIFTVKPIEKLLDAQQKIRELIQNRKPRLLIVGGGPAGLEITGNTWRLVNDRRRQAQITLLAGNKLLSRFPEKARCLALESLQARGVEVIEGVHLSRLETEQAILTDGRRIAYDFAFLALGVKPSPLFLDSGLPAGPEGGLLVNDYLQSIAYPDIFGGGDCINLVSRPLDKVGVYAVRQNPILFHNLMAALEGRNLQPFDPGGDYLLIFNLGNGRAIFCRKNLILDGRLAFYLKDYIDRKFMRKYQVSGELEE